MDIHVCRICGGAQDLKNILEQDSEIVDKLLKCANIHIHSGDVLPKLICEQCDRNLEVSYRLRKQSEETQKRLQLRIEMNKNDQYSEEQNKKCNLELGETPFAESYQGNNDLTIYEQTCGPRSSANIFNVELKTEGEFQTLDDDSRTSKLGEENMTNPIIAHKISKNEVHEVGVLKSESLELENGQHGIDEVLINDDEYGIHSNKQRRNEDSTVIEHCSINLLSSPSRSETETSVCDNKSESDKVECELNGKHLFTCFTCQNVFSSKKDYIVHIKEHGRERYQCIQCCKFFPTSFRLKRHEEIHNENIIHQCSYCERTYRGLHSLQRHIQSAHLNRKCLMCSICNITFSRIDVLKRHMQLHSDKKDYTCSLCSQSFKTRDYLNAHNRSYHEKNVKICKNTKQLKPKDTKKFQCGYCGKLFKSSFPYKNHILIHKNEKPYECETCHKNFRTIAALTTHQRIHDDYRPYQCDVCLKSFKQTSHLKEHKLLHLENPPQHTCSVCQSSFTKKSNLKTHMKLHSIEKPFKCAECCAEFTYVHLLQQHANKVHNRTVSKEYLTTETVDLTEQEKCHNDNDAALEPEIFHYIDTVADNSPDHNEDDIIHLIGENEISSTELKIQNVHYSTKNYIHDENSAFDKESFTDYIHIDSSSSVSSLQSKEIHLTENINEEEVHITEGNIKVFVNEETIFMSPVFNIDESV